MTADPSAGRERDAKIFALISKGALGDDSAVDDGSGGPAIALRDHPRYKRLLALAQMGRSVSLLKSASLWESREPIWRDDLAKTPFARVLFRIFQEHRTGFLAVIDGEHSKVVAFAAGVAATSTSTLPDEQLGAFLLREGLVTSAEAQKLAQLCRESGQPLGWALLKLGLMEPEDIAALLERQAKQRLSNLFTWERGQVAFYEDQRASQFQAVIYTPLMSLLRRGLLPGRYAELPALDALAGPLWSIDAPLTVLAPLGTLEFFLEGAEGAVVAAARDEQTPEQLRENLAGQGEEAIAEALRALYVLVFVGALGFAGAPTPLLSTALDLARLEDEERRKAAARLRERVESGEVAPTAEELAAASAPVEAPGAPVSARDELLARLANARAEREVSEGKPAAATSAAAGEGKAQAAIEPQATPGAIRVADQLDEYRLQLRLEEESRRLLHTGDFEGAAAKLSQLAAAQAKPVESLAYLAVALLLTDKPLVREDARGHARRACQNGADNALAHAAMSRALEALEEVQGAEHHKKRALGLSQHNDAYYHEVLSLLDLGRGESSRQAVAAPVLVSNTPYLVVALVFVGLFLLSNVAKVGAREYFYDPRDPFFWGRRALLIIAAIVGVKLAFRDRGLGLKAMGWKLDGVGMLLGLGLGLLIGYLSPPQRVTSGLPLLLGMTALHVVAEELFFRGFLVRLLVDRIQERGGAVIVSGALFGLYHLTYYSFWFETDLIPKFYWMAAIALCAGMPYAWLYKRKASLVPPLVAHAAVNGVMMAMSVLNR